MLLGPVIAASIGLLGEIHQKIERIYEYIFNNYEKEFVFPVYLLTGLHDERVPEVVVIYLYFWSSGFT